jgi:hypothetical protein
MSKIAIISDTHKEIVYIPYTYLIGWSKLNKWYYGSRYAMKSFCIYETGCHPDDFWLTYFTSSNLVTAFREENGEPDVVQIRKTFSNEEDARYWEGKVLQRMDVVTQDKWINGTDVFPPPPMYGEDHPQYIDGRSSDTPEYQREWRENNPEKAREGKRKWCEENPEKARESNRKSCRKWREENPEKARESNQKWRENNPERARESNRKSDRKSRAKKKLEKSLQIAGNTIL